MLQAKTQDIIPESGLGPQNSQWRRWVETSITNMKRGLVAFKADIANSFKAISSSLELLTKQVAQLNTASDTKDAYLDLSPGSTPSSQTARTNYDVVSLAFTKPAWATRAVVFASVTVTASGTLNGPSDFTAIYARIAGVNSNNFSTSVKAPIESMVYSGGIPNGDMAYSNSPVVLNVPFTRTLAVPEATLDCSVRISKGFTGAGHAYATSIGATVFWFAT